MPITPVASTLPDEALVREAVRLVRVDREATAALVRVLMEVDARRLYMRDGCSSLFVWCVRVLGLEEGAAYNRIEVARVARRFPAAIDALERGVVSLTAVRLLAPHLTAVNHVEVLARARGLRKREVQRLVAELAPRPDVATTVRKLPSAAPPTQALATADDASQLPPATMSLSGLAQASPPATATLPVTGRDPSPARSATAAAACAAARPTGPSSVGPVPATPGLVAPAMTTAAPAAVVAPLSLDRYKLQMTITVETHEKLRLAQDLLRHTVPDGDLSEILDRALTVLVRQLERQRFAATATPRTSGKSSSTTRYIPAFVRRAVWQRDGGQCAFTGHRGRCHERSWLEFHHKEPYAAGGAATVDNISLRCRAHNAFEASLFFGAGATSGPSDGASLDGRARSPSLDAARDGPSDGRRPHAPIASISPGVRGPTGPAG